MILRLQDNEDTRLPLGKKRRPASPWARVRHAMSPEADPEDRLPFAHLSSAERKAEVRTRKRARVVALLRELALLDEDGLARLDRMSHQDFFPEVRRLSHESRVEREESAPNGSR